MLNVNTSTKRLLKEVFFVFIILNIVSAVSAFDLPIEPLGGENIRSPGDPPGPMKDLSLIFGNLPAIPYNEFSAPVTAAGAIALLYILGIGGWIKWDLPSRPKKEEERKKPWWAALLIWWYDMDGDGVISEKDEIRYLLGILCPPLMLWDQLGKIEILTEDGCGDNKVLLGVLYFFDNDWDGRLTARDIAIEVGIWVGTLGLGRVAIAAGKGVWVGARLIKVGAKAPRIARALRAQSKLNKIRNFDKAVIGFARKSNTVSKTGSFLMRHPRLTKLMHVEAVTNTYFIKAENIKDWQRDVDRTKLNKNVFHYSTGGIFMPGYTMEERARGLIWAVEQRIMIGTLLLGGEGALVAGTGLLSPSRIIFGAARNAHRMAAFDIGCRALGHYTRGEEYRPLEWAMEHMYDMIGLSPEGQEQASLWMSPPNPYAQDMWAADGTLNNMPYWFHATQAYREGWQMIFHFSLPIQAISPILAGTLWKMNPWGNIGAIPTRYLARVPVVGKPLAGVADIFIEEVILEVPIGLGFAAALSYMDIDPSFTILGIGLTEFMAELFSEGGIPGGYVQHSQSVLSEMEKKFGNENGFYKEIKNSMNELSIKNQAIPTSVLGNLKSVYNNSEVELGGKAVTLSPLFHQALFQNAKVWQVNDNEFVTFREFVELKYFGKTSSLNPQIMFLNEREFREYLGVGGYTNIDNLVAGFNSGSVLVGDTIIIKSNPNLSIPEMAAFCAKEMGKNFVVREHPGSQIPYEMPLLNGIGVGVGTFTGITLSETYSNELFKYYAARNFHVHQDTLKSQNMQSWINSNASSFVKSIESFAAEFNLSPQVLTQVMSVNPHFMQLAVAGQLPQLQAELKTFAGEFGVKGEAFTNIIANQQLTQMIVSQQLQTQNIQGLIEMGFPKPIAINALNQNPGLGQMTHQEFMSFQKKLITLSKNLNIPVSELAPLLSSQQVTQDILSGKFQARNIGTLIQMGFKAPDAINIVARNPALSQMTPKQFTSLQQEMIQIAKVLGISTSEMAQILSSPHLTQAILNRNFPTQNIQEFSKVGISTTSIINAMSRNPTLAQTLTSENHITLRQNLMELKLPETTIETILTKPHMIKALASNQFPAQQIQQLATKTNISTATIITLMSENPALMQVITSKNFATFHQNLTELSPKITTETLTSILTKPHMIEALASNQFSLQHIQQFADKTGISTTSVINAMSRNPTLAQTLTSENHITLRQNLMELKLPETTIETILTKPHMIEALASNQFSAQHIKQFADKTGISISTVVNGMTQNPSLAQMTSQQFTSLQQEMIRVAAELKISTSEIAPALKSSHLTQAMLDGNFPTQHIQTISSQLNIPPSTVINAMSQNPVLSNLNTRQVRTLQNTLKTISIQHNLPAEVLTSALESPGLVQAIATWNFTTKNFTAFTDLGMDATQLISALSQNPAIEHLTSKQFTTLQETLRAIHQKGVPGEILVTTLENPNLTQAIATGNFKINNFNALMELGITAPQVIPTLIHIDGLTTLGIQPSQTLAAMIQNPVLRQIITSEGFTVFQQNLTQLSKMPKMTTEALTSVLTSPHMVEAMASTQFPSQSIQQLAIKTDIPTHRIIKAMTQNPTLAQMTPKQFSTLQQEMIQISKVLGISTTEMAQILSSSHLTQTILNRNFPTQHIQELSGIGIPATQVINAMSTNTALTQVITSKNFATFHQNLTELSPKITTETLTSILTKPHMIEALASHQFSVQRIQQFADKTGISTTSVINAMSRNPTLAQTLTSENHITLRQNLMELKLPEATIGTILIKPHMIEALASHQFSAQHIKQFADKTGISISTVVNGMTQNPALARMTPKQFTSLQQEMIRIADVLGISTAEMAQTLGSPHTTQTILDESVISDSSLYAKTHSLIELGLPLSSAISLSPQIQSMTQNQFTQKFTYVIRDNPGAVDGLIRNIGAENTAQIIEKHNAKEIQDIHSAIDQVIMESSLEPSQVEEFFTAATPVVAVKALGSNPQAVSEMILELGATDAAKAIEVATHKATAPTLEVGGVSVKETPDFAVVKMVNSLANTGIITFKKKFTLQEFNQILADSGPHSKGMEAAIEMHIRLGNIELNDLTPSELAGILSEEQTTYQVEGVASMDSTETLTPGVLSGVDVTAQSGISTTVEFDSTAVNLGWMNEFIEGVGADTAMEVFSGLEPEQAQQMMGSHEVNDVINFVRQAVADGVDVVYQLSQMKLDFTGDVRVGTAGVAQAVSAAVIWPEIQNARAPSAATKGLTENWEGDRIGQAVGGITNTVEGTSIVEDSLTGSIGYTSPAQSEQVDSTFTLQSIREAVNDEISKLDDGEWKTICSDEMERGIAAIEEVSRPLNDEGIHLLFRLDQTNQGDVRDFNVFFKEKLIPAYKEILHLSDEECVKLRGVKVEFRGGNWMTMHDPVDNKIIVYLDSIASGRDVNQERLMYGYGVLHELTHGVIRALSNSQGVNMISGADYVSEGFAIKCPRLIAGMFKGDPWFNALSRLDESIVFIQKEFGLDSVDESYYAQFRLTDVGSFRNYMSVERRKSDLMPSDLKPCSNVDELRNMGVAGLIANLGSRREEIRQGAHDSLSRISREVETYTGVSEIRGLMEEVKLLCPGMGEGGQVK